MKLVGLLASWWRNNKPLKLIGLFAGKSLCLKPAYAIWLGLLRATFVGLKIKNVNFATLLLSSEAEAAREQARADI
jgi:hypothetical protein